MEACVTNKTNLGVTRCVKLPSMPKAFFTTPASATIPAATLADAATLQTFLQGKLVADPAERWYLWPNLVNIEDVSEEAVYRSTVLSVQAVRDGRYQFRGQFQESLCIHKAMFTHRGKGDRVFVVDIENQLIGTMIANGAVEDMKGFLIDLLHTEKLKWNNGTDPTVIPMYLSLADNKELDQNGGMVDIDFLASLSKLTDVEITQVSADATNIEITVKNRCDGESILGLALADFVALDAAGDPIVITARSYADGVYTLTSAADFVNNGTIDLVLPAALTIKAYESTGPLTVDI